MFVCCSHFGHVMKIKTLFNIQLRIIEQNMLKQNTQSKIVVVREYLKFSFDRFHNLEGCSKF